jgi:hypothetical protein
MEKRIICIGYDLPGHSNLHHSYSSNQSLLDADIILFQPDLEGYRLNYEGESHYRGKKCFSHDSSFDIQEDSSRWKGELSVALASGKTIFVFLKEYEDIFVFSGQKEYSGTGRNRQTTNIVNPYHNYHFFPIKLPLIVPKHGKEVVFSGSPTFSTFWSEFKSYIQYESYLDQKMPNAFLLTRTGEKTLAAHFKVGKGNLVLLPALNYGDKKFIRYDIKKKKNLWTADAMKFGKKLLSTITDIDKVLRKEGERTPPPEWVSIDAFNLNEEKELKSAIEATNIKIDSLINTKNELTMELDKVGKLKDLLFEKGKNLENAINSALQILGYKAENYNDGNLELDHVILSPEGDKFIGEAEGKDTSAISIDKFRQLTLNIHEDAQREEVTEPAIGVLFGNGFRLKKPEEREEQFTTKCLVVAKTSNCILIRTSDLFMVTKYIKESGDVVFAESCRLVIKNSIGKVVTFPARP